MRPFDTMNRFWNLLAVWQSKLGWRLRPTKMQNVILGRMRNAFDNNLLIFHAINLNHLEFEKFDVEECRTIKARVARSCGKNNQI